MRSSDCVLTGFFSVRNTIAPRKIKPIAPQGVQREITYDINLIFYIVRVISQILFKNI